MPSPVKIGNARTSETGAAASACAAAREVSSAPAFRTSAQAVPSGYFRYPCCATIKARRSGIIMRIPSSPPSTATSITRVNSRSKPRIMIAGMVTPTPKAIDSPADPAVCTILFSSMFALRKPIFDSARNSVIEITATGIEALTVKPVFSTRYRDEALKIIPNTVPIISGNRVNSGNTTLAGMYGRKVARYGLSGLKPTRSGNSCAAAASPGVITSLDIGYDLRLVLQKQGEGLGKDRATLHGKRGRGEEETGR